jgi:hypothetical protein
VDAAGSNRIEETATMRARPSFWCKCRDAYERAWRDAMHKAAQDTWARTHKLTDKFFDAVETEYEEDAPDWKWREGEV